MAIQPGCQWALAQRGGPAGARQCCKFVVLTLRVTADDRPAPESMPVCAEHGQTLTTRQHGIIYREVGNVPTPVKVTLTP